MTMNKCVFLCCISLLLHGPTADGSPGYRIYNGIKAQLGQFPSVVLIFVTDGHMCSGVIIDEWFVLTAAHCVCKKSNTEVVIAGITNAAQMLNQSEKNAVRDFRFHDYDCNKTTVQKTDLAVLLMRDSFKFSKNVAPSKLKQVAQHSAVVTIAGFGFDLSAPESENVGLLKYYNVTLKNVDCRGLICFDNRTNEGYSYFGDSGGPMFDGEEVIGICSGGIPDAAASNETKKVIFTILYVSVHANHAFILTARKKLLPQLV